jgi:hypothetical protein
MCSIFKDKIRFRKLGTGADSNCGGVMSSCLRKRNVKIGVSQNSSYQRNAGMYVQNAIPTTHPPRRPPIAPRHIKHTGGTSHLSQAYRLVTRLTSTLLFLSNLQLLEEVSPMNAVYARQSCRSDVRVAVRGSFLCRFRQPPSNLLPFG